MNERTRERELAERRALALKKLAKVFGTNGGDTTRRVDRDTQPGTYGRKKDFVG